MNTTNPDVVIIGAGLTGLTMGFYLKKAGVNFLIIDKSAKTGGVIQTIREKGFVYETGPNTGVVSYPEMTELFEDLAGKCELEVADPNAKRRLIWKNNQWNALPSGLWSAVTTPLFTWGDKFRILGEPWRAKGTDPNEKLSDLVKRRLGKKLSRLRNRPIYLRNLCRKSERAGPPICTSKALESGAGIWKFYSWINQKSQTSENRTR